MTGSDDLRALTVAELLDAIGAKQPTPGGGAVAALTGALATALARMVVAYSLGRRTLADHEPLHAAARDGLAELEARCLSLAADDAAAYGRLNELWRLPEEDERRSREMPAAVEAAIDVPQRALAAALETLALLDRLGGTTNRMLDSDLGIAAVLAEAAARAAAWNVRVNLPLLADPDDAARRGAASGEDLDRARRMAAAIEAACAERGSG